MILSALLSVFPAFPIVSLCQSDSASPSATESDGPNPRHSTCPQDIRDTANGYTVNSTGIQRFRFDGEQDSSDWFVSLTINDTRLDALDQAIQDRGNFISVPESAQGRVCVYQFRELNATALGDKLNGCEGVLSEECVQQLQSIMPGPSDSAEDGGADSDEEDIECGAPDRVKIREACGDEVRIVAYVPISFMDASCTVPTPPAISLPSGYRTYSAVGISFLDTDSELDEFARYDLRLRQTVPHVITANLGERAFREAQVVCVAPNEVVEGSRVPEGDFPGGGVLGVDAYHAFSRSVVIATVLGALMVVG